ncbi:MAG: Uma2 family endonuclease [Bacteroidota bacterium]
MMTETLEAPQTINRGFFWSLERYHRAIDVGVFTEDDKIELLYGTIVELMPAGTLHEECVSLLADFFRYRFGRDYRYREEKSISIPSTLSEPEPDFVVVVNKTYGDQRPGPDDIHFIAEVANSSLKDDRAVKVKLYAEANLAEYWIVNLVNRQIEVHLNPDPEQKLYGSVTHYKEEATFISPFAGEVVVKELLPDEEETEA